MVRPGSSVAAEKLHISIIFILQSSWLMNERKCLPTALINGHSPVWVRSLSPLKRTSIYFHLILGTYWIKSLLKKFLPYVSYLLPYFRAGMQLLQTAKQDGNVFPTWKPAGNLLMSFPTIWKGGYIARIGILAIASIITFYGISKGGSRREG